jgi:hypothetical protein
LPAAQQRYLSALLIKLTQPKQTASFSFRTFLFDVTDRIENNNAQIVINSAIFHIDINAK